MDLCSVTDIELYLLTTITGEPEEPKYESLITSVSAEIEAICNRKILADDYVEVYDGTGNNELYLNQF